MLCFRNSISAKLSYWPDTCIGTTAIVDLLCAYHKADDHTIGINGIEIHLVLDDVSIFPVQGDECTFFMGCLLR